MDRRRADRSSDRYGLDPAEARRRRRHAMNEVRRKVERDARVADVAGELAGAAERVLADPAGDALDALRRALSRYREASRD